MQVNDTRLTCIFLFKFEELEDMVFLFVGTFGRIYQGTLLSETESETELGADQGIIVKTVSGRTTSQDLRTQY